MLVEPGSRSWKRVSRWTAVAEREDAGPFHVPFTCDSFPQEGGVSGEKRADGGRQEGGRGVLSVTRELPDGSLGGSPWRVLQSWHPQAAWRGFRSSPPAQEERGAQEHAEVQSVVS